MSGLELGDRVEAGRYTGTVLGLDSIYVLVALDEPPLHGDRVRWIDRRDVRPVRLAPCTCALQAGPQGGQTHTCALAGGHHGRTHRCSCGATFQLQEAGR